MKIDLTLLPRDEFLKLVGKSNRTREYYAKVHDNMSQNKIAKWNWAAAFFNLSWLFYKRLYKEAIIVSIIYYAFSFFISLIFLYFSVESNYHNFLNFILTIIFGYLGNYIYISSLLLRAKFKKRIPSGSSLTRGYILGGLIFCVSNIIIWLLFTMILHKIITYSL